MHFKLPEEWHNVLHRLWSKAVGTPDYVKSEWMELERILVRAAEKMAQQGEGRDGPARQGPG